MLLIVGGECLLIDSATVYAGGDESAESFEQAAQGVVRGTRQLTPAEWVPWTLLSSGAIVVIYAFALPRRWHGAGG